MSDIELVIKIPEGLKNDFVSEQWTALSCMEMKDALMNGTPLPKGHGRLIDADALENEIPIDVCDGFEVTDIIEAAPTIIKAESEET